MSDKAVNNNFISLYGATKRISSSQYLAEFIVKRRAEKSGVVLPMRFWTSKSVAHIEWRKIYQREVRFAAAILKKSNILIVLAVLHSNEGSYFLTLSNKNLHNIVERETRKQQQEEAITIQNEMIVTDVNVGPKNMNTKKKSKLGMLRDN